jgi:hypothetical protein
MYHTVQRDGIPQEEDEADFFAGHALRYLGYSEEEVRSFVLSTAPRKAAGAYRAAGERVGFFLKGWRSAADILAGTREPSPSMRRLVQATITEDSLARFSGLVQSEWQGYLRLTGARLQGRADTVTYAIARDHRIYAFDPKADPVLIGSKRPPSIPGFAWSWETADGILNVTPAGLVMVRLPSGRDVTIGEILAPQSQ